jgi:hypothetical protein
VSTAATIRRKNASRNTALVAGGTLRWPPQNYQSDWGRTVREAMVWGNGWLGLDQPFVRRLSAAVL